MSKRLRIQEWPFGASELVILQWISSPWQEGFGKQWRTAATFKSGDGSLRSVDLPWGALPQLRLGQAFINGHPADEGSVGEILSLSLAGAVWQEVFARDALPLWCPFRPSADAWNERCFQFAVHSKTIVVPTIECVRALLAVNKALSYGVLEPAFFKRSLVRNDIQEGCLHLEFNKQIARSALTTAVVAHVGRLLHDPSFLDAWSDVYRRRFVSLATENSQHASALSFRLPDLDSNWRVRVLRRVDTTVVLEILAVQPTTPLPYEHITFDHPSMVEAKRHRPHSPSADKLSGERQGGSQQSIFLNVDPRPRPPKNSGEPRLAKLSPLAVGSPFRVPVNPLTLTKRRTLERRGSEGADIESSLALNAADDGLSFSLSDSGIAGTWNGAEFKPEELQEEVALNEGPFLYEAGDGFNRFAEAIDYITAFYSKAAVGWLIAQMATANSAFAQIGDRRRRYAVVSIRWGAATCWVLEFGRPDGQSPSTLLFRLLTGTKRWGGFQGILARLMTDALDAGGSWHQPKIDGLAARRILKADLVKHDPMSTDAWGRLLYRRAAALAGVHFGPGDG